VSTGARWLVVAIASLTTLASRAAAAESHGLADRGVFSDLDPRVALEPPRVAAAGGAIDGVIDDEFRLLVVYAAGRAVAAFPTAASGATAPLRLGEHEVTLRPSDAPLAARLLAGRPVVRRGATPVRGGDRDRDGIPDALDLLLGAKKVALNGARYEGGYVRLPYPGGDVARDTGVCTDVIVRAMRNAGVDLQVAVHEDIARAPRAYPMVKRRDPNIDHRRVKTFIGWFRRHLPSRGTDPTDDGDPFLPGDIVFFDTFPTKPGPDHVGIVSDRVGSSGLYLVVNNWTDGYVESEMDLLPLIPVTHRFRMQ
jgi:uncharacterized protein YijF (DUF1287 family)